MIGVVLISGAFEDGAYGAHPARGVLFGALTGIAYAGFILILRHGNEDLRRPAGPLFDATWVAAVASLVVALALGESTTSRRRGRPRVADLRSRSRRRCWAGC